MSQPARQRTRYGILHEAFRSGSLATVLETVKQHDIPERFLGSFMGAAAESGNPELVSLVESKGGDVDFFALSSAVAGRHPEMVARMLKRLPLERLTLTERDRLLTTAVFVDDVKVARDLLALGARVRPIDEGPFRLIEAVVLEGSVEMLRLFLAIGEKPDWRTLEFASYCCVLPGRVSFLCRYLKINTETRRRICSAQNAQEWADIWNGPLAKHWRSASAD